MLSWPYHVDEKDMADEDWTPEQYREGKTVASYVLRTGKSMHAASQAQALTQAGDIEIVGTLSEDAIFVPLKDDKRTLGVVAVQSYTKGVGYSEEDVQLLAFVGQHIAAALTRARAIEETRQRNAELAIINSVQAGLASKLDFHAIIDMVGDKLRATFQADTTYVYLYDRHAEQIRRPYYVERGHRHTLEAVPFGEGLTSIVIRTCQPLLLGTNDEMEKLNVPGMNVASPDEEKDLNETYLGVPILVGDEVMGVVSLQSYQKNAYAVADMRVLITVANSMGVALENARLFDETQRLLKETEQRAAELAIINSVQEGLASKLDMRAIYSLVGNKIHEVFADAQEVGILTYDPETDLFDPQYAIERGVRLEIQPWKPIGFRKHVLETRQPMVINRDAERLSAEFKNPLIAGERAKSYAFVPMTIGDQVTGLIELQHMDREDAFSDADVRLLQTLAGSMSVALENARLFDEVQKRNSEISEALEQQTATSEILRVIVGSPTDIQPVLDAVAESAARLCELYDAAIARVEGGVYKVVSQWGPVPLPEENVREGIPVNCETVTGRAILEQRSIHVDDVLAEPELSIH